MLSVKARETADTIFKSLAQGLEAGSLFAILFVKTINLHNIWL